QGVKPITSLEEHAMRAVLRTPAILLALAGVSAGTTTSSAQTPPPAPYYQPAPQPGPPPAPYYQPAPQPVPPPDTYYQPAPAPPPQVGTYRSDELVDAGHRFFGGGSRGLATVIAKAVGPWGVPNRSVLGEGARGH